MNPIIMQLKMQKAKLEQEYKEQKIKALRCINELQNANPYFGDDISLIEAEKLEQSGDELLLVKMNLLKIQREIKEINMQLGSE